MRKDLVLVSFVLTTDYGGRCGLGREGDVRKAAVAMARLQYLKRVKQQLQSVLDVA
jgi:hypothetical protein